MITVFKKNPVKKFCLRNILVLLFLFAAQNNFAQSLADGVRAITRENFQTASRIFKNLIATNPSEPDNYYYLGQTYCSVNKWDSARIIFQQGITAAPKGFSNYVGLGKTYLNQNNTTEANTQFDKAKTLCSTKNIAVLVMIAEAMTNVEFPLLQNAINLMEQAQAVNDDAKDVLMKEGDAYAKMNNGTGQAYNYYIRVLYLDSNDIVARTKIGTIWIDGKQFELSKPQLEKAIKIDSTFGPAWRELAELYYNLGEFDKAEKFYKKYLLLADNNDYTRYRYAQFLFLGKKYEQCLEILTDLMKRDNNPIMRRLAGYCNVELSDYGTGKSLLDEYFTTVKLEKIIPSDYKYLGTIYQNTGKPDLMIRNFLKAIQLDTTLSTLYDDIANSYSEREIYDSAAVYFSKKIKYYTEAGLQLSVNDYMNVATSYYFDSAYVKADTAFKTISDLLPDWPVSYIWRARAENQLEPKKDTALGYAIPMFEITIQKIGTDTVKYLNQLLECYSSIGDIYRLQAKYEESLPWYEKYIKMAPADDPYLESYKDIVKQINLYLKSKGGSPK